MHTMSGSHDRGLQIAETLAAAHFRTQYEHQHPAPLSQEDLYQKVRSAAGKALGIEEVAFLEWRAGLLTTWQTDGCVREPRYMNLENIQDVASSVDEIIPSKDVGYLQKVNKLWTVRSFLTNPWSFSNDAYARFRMALEAEGLKPGSYSGALTPLFPTPKDQEAWENRPILYR